MSTPTPWAQHEDEPRVIVALAAPTMSLLGIDYDDTAAVVLSAEDAALIVHRVNVHDDLLAALKWVQQHAIEAASPHEFSRLFTHAGSEGFRVLGAAIARAEGGES